MRTLLSLAVVSSAIIAAVYPAQAQTPPRTPQEQLDIQAEPGERDTVLSRARPEYDPLGVRLGGFFLYPKAELTEYYRDNVYFDDTNEESDFVTVVSPSVALRSNWNNHALNFFAGADVGRYADNTSEDYVDWQSGFDGRIDIDRSMNLRGGFTFAHEHERRSDPDQAGAVEPVEYDRYGPDVEFTKRFNRLAVQLGSALTVYDFDSAAGAQFDQDARDRTETTGTVRLGYEIVPSYEAFVRGTVNDRDHDQSAASGRDSQGWEMVAGVALDLGGVTFGNVYAGYLRQEYDAASLPTVEGVSFGGDLTWNPTGLTTVTLAAERTVEETLLSGAAGALSTQIRAGVDHELLRNVILSGDATYENNDYEGITREDDIYAIGGGAQYLFNRYLRLGLSYTYETRESTVANADYDTNTVYLRLITQY